MMKKRKYSLFTSIFFITCAYAHTPLTEHLPVNISQSLIECSSSQRENLLFTEGFGQEDIETNWGVEVCSTCPYSLNKTSSLARSGSYSARFELRQDDPYSTSGRKRTELAQRITEPNGKRERWYGFSIYLPLDYDYDSEAEIVAQWHAVPDKSPQGERLENWRSPPLALLTYEGGWQVDWRWDEQKTTVDIPTRKHRRLGEYDRGQWTDWVFHVHWSYENDGHLEVWKNGVKVLSKKGPIGYNDDKGTYMKLGIYKWAWTSRKSLVTKRILYIDAIYKGGKDANYCDVAPHRTR